MTTDQIAGFAWARALNKNRDYFAQGFPEDKCALIVTVLDMVEQDARMFFAAAQPGKPFPEYDRERGREEPDETNQKA